MGARTEAQYNLDPRAAVVGAHAARGWRGHATRGEGQG